MRHSKILLMSLPVLLAGCLDSFDSDSDTFYTQPAPPVPVSVPPVGSGPDMTSGKGSPTLGKSDCGCPGKTSSPAIAIPCEALPPSSPPAADADADWNPNEGQLVEAGELVMELQRRNGGVRPSHAAMATHIRTHMGLSAPHAEKVLEEMGL